MLGQPFHDLKAVATIKASLRDAQMQKGFEKQAHGKIRMFESFEPLPSF